MLETVQLAAHGTPYIKSATAFFILNIVGTVSDIFKNLRLHKFVPCLFKNQYPVILRIVCQINRPVADNHMTLAHIVGQNRPIREGVCEIVMVNNLVVVAVY